MWVKKELIRIFGNITYAMSYALRQEPKIICVDETTQSQLFYFPKHNNILYGLYLDGVDNESVCMFALCVNPDIIDSYKPAHILGEDVDMRVSNIYIFRTFIPYSASDVLMWTSEDIMRFVKDNKAFYKQQKKLFKAKKQLNNFRESFTFIPHDIDIQLNLRK